ncbi:lipid-binding SYLF domain-containing protein [Gallaecimonas sp. GXIMD4217]|uniref:lipid-binding SYLF domain-containing protein n=1 Tax=Gallaecimonas sp. GXIMD4217 TaxID=3131927 RepID=UPI00311B2097
MRLLCSVLLALLVGLWPGAASAEVPANGLQQEVDEAIDAFLESDPGLKVFFNRAHGYVVFPKVGKAGLLLGGAYGKGLVYRKGQLVGKAKLRQMTLGFQIGGQTYRQLIFFKNKAAFERFTQEKLELGAQASAVALDAGASTNVDYSQGVAVFTLAIGGLMYEASLSGQVFSYSPYGK